MSAPEPSYVCALTGASGFVGGRLKSYLQQQGFQIQAWTRQAVAASGGVGFQLGQEVAPQQFTGINALVHCAYDFSPRRWTDVVSINVRGSENLLRAAKAAGVERQVFISSLSAFEGCRSLYGQAKLQVEKLALELGALVIRPGLVYGDRPGGVFGGLVKQVQQARFVPLLSGGNQPQYLVHADDVGKLIARFLSGELGRIPQPVTLAHEKPWPMRDLLTQIGIACGRQPRFVSVPWRLVWVGLKTLETLRLPAPFRSDSLVGYVYQNPAPDFSVARGCNADCRPFQISRDILS